jgi:L-asparaginase
MPAGNYATAHAAVSCTGIGEDIIDECLAARIVVRVTDGLSLQDAMQRSFAEAQQHNRDLGAIALDATGAIACGKNKRSPPCRLPQRRTNGDTIEWTGDVLTVLYISICNILPAPKNCNKIKTPA